MVPARSAIETERIRRQLERILVSKVFVSAQRSQAFLRYVVEKSIAGLLPKEYELAIDVFERSTDYDPAIDATVRVEASRLRNRLREYYDTEGKRDPILIEIPKGGYSAVFTFTGQQPEGNSADLPEDTPGTSQGKPEKNEHTGVEAAPGNLPEAATSNPHNKSATHGNRRVLAWISLFLALFLSAAFSVWAFTHWKHAHTQFRSLAVLPLQNLSGDPGQDYFAAGMTDELTTQLARIPGLRVVSRTSAFAASRSPKSVQQIANALQVDAVVEGSIVRAGDRIRITAQLIDARTDRHIWAQSFEGPASDVLSLQDSVAQQIASQAPLGLVPPAPRAPANPVAYDAYLRGRYFLNRQEFSRSLQYFQQAISLDPSYPSAYAGYATALDAAATFDIGPADKLMPEAIAAAQHAIQLDPENGEAYTALGSVQTIYSWNWAEADQNLTRGIALNPNDSIAEFKYAVYLDAVGRPQDAVTHMRRALQLDPVSFFVSRRLGATLYLARQYDAALAQFQRAAQMEDQPGTVDNYLSLIYEQKGDHDQAVQHDLIALKQTMPKIDEAALSAAYRQHGWQSYWVARNHALLNTPAHPCIAYQIGVDDLRLNDRDQAFDAFQHAIDGHCIYMAFIRVDPLFDSVRADPRYTALLTRIRQ
ncbi:MAG: hypothetical protein KGN79_04320 [Acidobacteriota bacterium]|nr:hypothetical protein [Acidobacteriota bacterium]